MKRALPWLIAALLAAGCTHETTKPAGPSKTSGNDVWTLTETDPNDATPALLWNGLIGVRIGRNGSGMDSTGAPLGFFMCDEYGSGPEEKILTMPNPILLTIAVGNEVYEDKKSDYDPVKSGGTLLDPKKGTDYSQTLDMKAGTLATKWTQDTPEAGKVQVSCVTLVHPDRRIIGQSWSFTCAKNTSFSIKSLDYTGPNDDQDPVGKDTKNQTFVSAGKSRVVVMTTQLTGADEGALATVGGFRVQEGHTTGKTVRFDRILAFGPHSQKPLPELGPENADKLKALTPKIEPFDQLQKETADHWARAWQTDIVIDGPVEDQRAIHSFLFYLRSAINVQSPMGLSPYGLSDSQYNGHVFWDADVWAFPALDLLDPFSAAAIPKYRLDRAKAASSNFSSWVLAGMPVSTGKMPPLHPGAPVPPGVKYPWESSVSGHETTPTASKYEDHVTGSVAWSLTQASSLGLANMSVANQVAAMAYNFYFLRSQPGPQGREIYHLMSPDENHVGPNDLYTNLLAMWITNGRRWPAKPSFKLPQDSQGFLNYDGDQFSGYKQASGILGIYPLQYPPAEKQAPQMLERLAKGLLPDGPPMTESLEALIQARTNTSDKAYDLWCQAWQAHTRNPLMLFSERYNGKQTYFTTGAAGCLQTVLYGFCGIRLDLQPQAGAIWSTPLLGQRILSVKPNLPPAWKSVKLQNFTVLGKRYTLTVGPNHSTVTLGE